MYFKYFGHHIEIFWKKVKIHVLGTDTDPHRPAPDRHALDADADADPDPDPAK
jgi:hypothetical protein